MGIVYSLRLMVSNKFMDQYRARKALKVTDKKMGFNLKPIFY
jgi:hypothetical protein